ncbi:MAG: hypothetical protein IKW58_02005 [Alphaproteobacteria bacterium]|nr:hypothetical protein [Alphaproteobacteria bacterium]
MSESKQKQDVRMIFKIGAFLAFIMLSYLGIRSYKKSVEQLKINQCNEQLIEFVQNIQETFRSQRDYGEFDYKVADRLKLFPKSMVKEGFKEKVNAYMGGVDVYYSSSAPDSNKSAFEVSFQGLSQMGCMGLMRLNLSDLNVIAVGAYPSPTPSGVLDEIYLDTKQTDIKGKNKFIGKGIQYLADDKAKAACDCSDNVCSVIWKFK